MQGTAFTAVKQFKQNLNQQLNVQPKLSLITLYALKKTEGTSMSMIICSECGQSVSDKAAACPNCGAPVECLTDVTTDSNYTVKKSNKNTKNIVISVIVCLIVAASVFAAINIGKESAGIGNSTGSSISETEKQALNDIDSDAANDSNYTGIENSTGSSISETEKQALKDMDSDAAELNKLLKKAVKCYTTNQRDVTWNGKTIDDATVHDVCVENGIDDTYPFYARKIGDNIYYIIGRRSQKDFVVAGFNHNEEEIKSGNGFGIDSVITISQIAEQYN